MAWRVFHSPQLLLSSLVLLISLLVAIPSAAAEIKRVLVVHSFGNAAPPFTTHSLAFETALTEQMGEGVDLDEVSLDVARYATLDMEAALVEFMRKRQTKWQPDLVVPVGSPAGVFVAQYRDRLFPAATPIIYTGMDQRRLPAGALQQNAAFVGESFDFPAMIEDILQVAPATTNIAVVIGASPLEQFWAEAIAQEWRPFTNRVSFTWLNQLSLDQMLARTAQLPPRSFIFLILLMRDASGVTHNADEVLKRIRAVANAPINSIYQHQLGMGIVGGRLYQAELEGVKSAEIAVRVLRGEAATNFPPVIVSPLGPRYDARELERWQISEKQLPAGSAVLFREPTVWARYKFRFVAIGALVMIQAALIFVLVANLSKRRQAEQTARELSGRLITAQESERSRLARELHDDITQRLARLAIDAGRIERSPAGGDRPETLRELREGLVQVSEDIHTLSYRLHPSLLEDLGLAAALQAECERFSRRESLPTAVQLSELPPDISRETALGLFRITQEALRNVARHARASEVKVSLRPVDEGLQLAIQDNGCGFEPARQRERLSLGLASMRERIRLLAGELEIESAPGHGATILAWVPLKKEKL